MYTNKDLHRQGPITPHETFNRSLRIKSMEGSFISEDIQKRWGMHIDYKEGKLVFDPEPKKTIFQKMILFLIRCLMRLL